MDSSFEAVTMSGGSGGEADWPEMYQGSLGMTGPQWTAGSAHLSLDVLNSCAHGAGSMRLGDTVRSLALYVSLAKHDALHTAFYATHKSIGTCDP